MFKSTDILYEDNHLIAINKKAGDLVQGDQTGDLPLVEQVKRFLKEKYQKPGKVFLGTIHRLDRPVSGVLVFARTSKALERMNRLFKERDIQKTYWAVVEKTPTKVSAELVHFIKRIPRKNISQAFIKAHPEAKKSILTYDLKASTGKFHLLEVYPKTGRHHQIRVQLASIGSIIVGDLKYGAPKPNADKSIHLHAVRLEFVHPVQKTPIVIQAIPNEKDAIWKDFTHILSL